MKVLNPIYGDYSGKLGSIVFNQTRSGTVVRSLGVGRRIQSIQQADNSNYRRNSLEKWRRLTIIEKALWVTYASAIYSPRPFARESVPSGYNCFCGMDYIKTLLSRNKITACYQNERTTDYYLTSELEPNTGNIPPTAEGVGQFNDDTTGNVVDWGPQTIDVTDSLVVEIDIVLSYVEGDPISIAEMLNTNGYNYTFVLYSSYPASTNWPYSNNTDSIHLATFEKIDEIHNAVGGDNIKILVSKEDINNRLRAVTQKKGYMTWKLYIVDEYGQFYFDNLLQCHTDELNTY